MCRRAVWLAIGLLLAPLLPALVLASLSPGLGVVSGDLGSLIPIAALLYLPAFFVVALLGLSVLAFLQHLDLVRWWTALLSGFVGGGLVALVVTDFRGLRADRFMADLPVSLIWAGCGSAVAMILWLCWKAGNAAGLERQ